MVKPNDSSFLIEEPLGLNERELDEVALLHRRELGEGFISSLGDGLLKLLFKSGMSSKSGVFLIARATKGGSIVGFLLGARRTKSFYREYLISNFVMTVRVLLPRLFSLGTIKRVAESLLYPGKKEHRELPRAELLDIVVCSKQQGKGLGQALFGRFSDTLQSEGIESFKITTGESLTGAQSFYTKLGAEFVCWMEVHAGSRTAVYTYRNTTRESYDGR